MAPLLIICPPKCGSCAVLLTKSIFFVGARAPASQLTMSSVADPASGEIVATFSASGVAAPDPSLNRVFFLTQSQAQTNTNNYTLVSFDQTTHAQGTKTRGPCHRIVP
jgi:hypothetical protein